MLGSKEERTNGIRRQAQELIDQAYERGFKAGKKAFVDTESKVVNEAYQKGLDDAWECADKLNRMTIDEVRSAFNPFGLTIERESVFMCCTPNIAIEKIRQYEEQKKAKEEEIKVGDEVIFNRDAPFKVIVTFVKHSGEKPLDYTVMAYNGMMWDFVKPNEITKTGRSFPQIPEVLKQLKETNDADSN